MKEKIIFFIMMCNYYGLFFCSLEFCIIIFNAEKRDGEGLIKIEPSLEEKNLLSL